MDCVCVLKIFNYISAVYPRIYPSIFIHTQVVALTLIYVEVMSNMLLFFSVFLSSYQTCLQFRLATSGRGKTSADMFLIVSLYASNFMIL